MGSAPPVPSSSMLTRAMVASRVSRTVTSVADECLIAFVTASETVKYATVRTASGSGSASA